MREIVKVKTIIENYEFLGKIKVYYIEDNGDVETYFEGTAFDCPYWVADLYLDTNADGEALSVGTETIDGEIKPYLSIYAREKRGL